mmetsp:Transcript_41160/g.71243  ORF Transcript_41160/g.71243 Transcript_41160/m.71243 type:complete len:227 (-) Transcript_41160:190-870(-)
MACHGVCEGILSIILIAVHLRLLHTQGEDLLRHFEVVAAGVQLTSAGPQLPGLFPQIATLRESDKRLDQTARQGDHVGALGHVAFYGGLTSCCDEISRQACEVISRESHSDVRLVRKQVLSEDSAQLSKLLSNQSILGLVFSRKLGTCAHKVQMEALHKTDLLSRQVTLISCLVHGVDALKQARQRRDLVLVGSKGSRHLQLHGLEFRHAIGGAEVVEHIHHLLKH